MNRLIGCVFICFSLATASFAQGSSDCAAIKTELEQVRSENEYLRNSLKIGKPVKVINSDNIEFRLLKVEGDTKNQTVTFTLTLTTQAANWYINSGIKSIIDIDGNEYRLKSHTIGAYDYGTISLNTNVPIKCTYTFKGILPGVKMIRLFSFDYRHSAGEPYSAEFRDITIDWK